MNARLVSLNIGEPQLLVPHSSPDKNVFSGIFKSPVSGAVWLGETGLEGDGQADLKNHGGPDKAVCVYPLEHYPYWTRRLRRDLPEGAFGENFTGEGLLESSVHIGDIYEVGDALVQVSQPRQPCFKLAARYNVKELALWVRETGFTGFYLRCLKPGAVQEGDKVLLVERTSSALTVAEANNIMNAGGAGVADVERLLMESALSVSWRRTLVERLLKMARG